MARLFFDLHECGTVVADEEGLDLPDLATAKKQGIAAARAIMCDEVTRGRLCLSCSIEIRDAGGRTVEKVLFKDVLEITGF